MNSRDELAFELVLFVVTIFFFFRCIASISTHLVRIGNGGPVYSPQMRANLQHKMVANISRAGVI